VILGCAMPEGATGHNIARQAALRAGAPGPVEAGELTIVVTVEARYRIDDGEDPRAPDPHAALVSTEQPLGAIVVYLCEPESDDGAVENGLIQPPAVDDDFAIWRGRGVTAT
jgi:hypothetical protein